MNNYLDDWSQQLDDLEFHLDMDTDQLMDTFETQKQTFSDYLTKAKEAFANLNLDEKGTKLKAELEHLQVQCALGKAETKDALEEQAKKLNYSLHEAKTKFQTLEAQAEEKGGEKLEAWKSEFENSSENFKTKLDIMRLKYALGKADAKDEMEAKRKELKEKLHEMRYKVKEKGVEEEGKLEKFGEEMTEAIGHFKSALKGLFS